MTADEMKAWRQRTGLSQAKAAQMIGCGRRSWQVWEAGEREIPRYIELALREAERIVEAQRWSR